MAYGELEEGFVPIAVELPGQRITGKAWKRAGRRLLEHIELGNRLFLPIVDAEVLDLSGERKSSQRLPVIAVRTASIVTIIPGDRVTAAQSESRRAKTEAGV